MKGVRVNGDIRIQAAGVMIRNTEVLGRVYNQDGDGHYPFTIMDSTVGRAEGCYETGEGAIGVDEFVALRVRVTGFSDAFRISGNNVRIQDSFVASCGNPDSHADGIQGYGGGQNIVLEHNTIDARVDVGGNSAIFFADGSRQAEVRDNLLLGGGFTLRLHDDTGGGTHFVVVGNRIGADSYGYGPTSVDDCDKGRPIEWTDNRLVAVDASYAVTADGGPLRCGG